MVSLLSPDPGNGDVSNGNLLETPRFSEDLDSSCSTPYVSAPSSPGRGASNGGGYFFSAPASPMHFMLYSAASATCPHTNSEYLSPQSDTSFEFEFVSRSSKGGSVAAGSMSSADELFLNGQIRPVKLSSHLQRPQSLAPLLDLDGEEDCQDDHSEQNIKGQQAVERGRDLKLRCRSLHRKARSLSPLRNSAFQWREEDCSEVVSERILELKDFESKQTETVSNETTPSVSASSSRSSSSGRNSKKWIFLKDLLNRSKSEGRGNGKEKFWSSISFSPSKDRKVSLPSLSLSKTEKAALSSSTTTETTQTTPQKHKRKEQVSSKKSSSTKPTNGVSKRRVPLSPHEQHYTANRAQAEEMKKRTYLPYRHGLLGCLGLSSKGYGALNGLARSLNPLSSR